MSLRSPINSSVSCRRAFLRRETHKLQLKLLLTMSQFVKWSTCKIIRALINFSPFCKSELVPFPPLSPPAVSHRLSSQRLHAQDQSASGKPGHKFIHTFEDARYRSRPGRAVLTARFPPVQAFGQPKTDWLSVR